MRVNKTYISASTSFCSYTYLANIHLYIRSLVSAFQQISAKIWPCLLRSSFNLLSKNPTCYVLTGRKFLQTSWGINGLGLLTKVEFAEQVWRGNGMVLFIVENFHLLKLCGFSLCDLHWNESLWLHIFYKGAWNSVIEDLGFILKCNSLDVQIKKDLKSLWFIDWLMSVEFFCFL